MPEDETKKEGGPGLFQLLRRCDEVEPRLGRLYESWNVVTGRPALTLFPRDSVEWRPTGPWRGWIFFDPVANSVSLELERRRVPESVTECMNVLTLLTLAGQCVEDSPQTNAHFTASPPSRLARWGGCARQVASSRRRGIAVGIVVFALGLGVWLERAKVPLIHERTPGCSPSLAGIQDSHTLVPAYPLPSKPFLDQAVPPCVTEQGATEIKGGCWIALERKPPCFTNSAEYEGKCYLPMPKSKPVPRSLDQ